MTQHATITRERTTQRGAPAPPVQEPATHERPGAFERMLSTHDGLGPLLLRLTLGIVFFAHGAQKVFGWFGGQGPGAAFEQFAAMGLPGWLAGFVMAAELGGAILLILGALTRLGALAILAVMVGAIATVHAQYGFFMNWGGMKAGEGFEYHLLAIGICLGLIAAGGGRWSVDRALERKREEQRVRERARVAPVAQATTVREETLTRRG